MSPDGGTVGQWDSGTAGKHMICAFFCPKYLGQWDGGTQEKHVQLGCQWDSRKIYDLCFVLSQIFGTVGQWDTRITCTCTVRLSVYICATLLMFPDGWTVGQWDSRKIYDLCFVLSQIFGTVGWWDTRITCTVRLSV